MYKTVKTHSLSRPNMIRPLALLSCLTFLAGCAVDGGSYEANANDEFGTAEQKLIGGGQAAPYHFRSTVGIGDVCTAAKVGPRLFLTAAHCVAQGRPRRGWPVPEGFPENDGVSDAFLPGESLHINWGLNAEDEEQADFTIAQTTIHPSWWECPLCQDPILAPGSAADIAVIQITQDTPQIPEAQVDLAPVAPGTQVVKVGWGCEERTNIDANTLQLGRYKTEDAWTLPSGDISQHNSHLTNGQLSAASDAYLFTAGHDRDENRASLCLGDSGGPLYIPNNNERRIVGVNSNYTFAPAEPGELGGVSWTDWHTKTSMDSLHGVGQWLLDLGVNTFGGPAPSSDCTCPNGCDTVQQATAPLTQSGQREVCYFFEELGYSVNNHSMIEVNLNGQNITNQWIGNWAYPAPLDGGYYLYVKAQLPWSSVQVSD